MKIEILENIDVLCYCINFFDNISTNEILDVIKNDALELLEHGEKKIAIENLCDNLYEYRVEFSRLAFTQLVLLCNYLNIDDKYLENLTENIKFNSPR